MLPSVKPPIPADNVGSTTPTARVLASARAHFFRHGLRGVTMDDLAAELGMSKKTLYVHFPSKVALLEAVIADKLDQLEADLHRLINQASPSFSGQLQDLLTCVGGHAEELQPAFLRDVRVEAPVLCARLQERRRQLILRYFGRLLIKGRRAGAVRRDVPVALLVETLVGAVNAIIASPLLEEFDLTPGDAFTQVTAVFLEGALVRKKKS